MGRDAVYEESGLSVANPTLHAPRPGQVFMLRFQHGVFVMMVESVEDKTVSLTTSTSEDVVARRVWVRWLDHIDKSMVGVRSFMYHTQLLLNVWESVVG